MIKMFKATLVWVLSFALVFQPLLANAQNIQVTGPDNGPRPRVDAAYNGTPVLNIGTPNSAGISHDIYTSFEANDLIINNSATNVNTQLGGWVEGNPNLVPGLSAQTWIGEVVGGNQTKLNGILEVGGKSLDVILANEFGITCNGCGFVNTNRATLTTGKPIFRVDGSLSGFNVKQGGVIIGSDGLNPELRLATSDLSRVDIVSRTAAIFGKLRADQANVVAGANIVNYDWSYNPDTGQVTGVTPQQGLGTTPALAVDVAALGGMYANAIQMVATESGVGVRLTGELVSSSNISLSANGKLSLGKASSGRVPKIKAKKKIRIRNKGPLLLEGSIISEENDDVDIRTSEGSITFTGEAAGGAVTLESAGLNNVSALITAQDELKIVSLEDNVEVQQPAVLEANSLVVEGAKSVLFDGQAKIADTAKLTAVESLKVGLSSKLNSEGTLDLNSGVGGLENFGTLSAQDVNFVSGGAMSNTGIISAGNNLNVTIETRFTNSSVLVAGNKLGIYANEIINNSGVIWSNGDLILASNPALDAALLIQNTNGRIESLQGDLTIRANEVHNVGTAPTLSESTIIKWLESAAAEDVDPVEQISNLVGDAYLDSDGNILPAYAVQYAELWAGLVNGGSNLSADAVSILNPTVVAANGTSLGSDFKGVWEDMYGRANSAGTPDPAAKVAEMVDPAIFDANGKVLPEHAVAYSQLWVALASGQTTVSDDVKLILLDTALTDPTGNMVTADNTNVWQSMTAGSGAPYDIINILYQDRLNDDGTLAEIVAGGSIDIVADKVHNIYANISAGKDISIVADEVQNKALGASQVLFQVKKKPGCFTCHTGDVDFYDSFGGRIEAVENVTIDGNLNNETVNSSELGQEDVISMMNQYFADKRAEGDSDFQGVPDASHKNLHFEEHRSDDYITPVAGNGDDIREVAGENTGATTQVDKPEEPALTPSQKVDQLLVAGLNTIAETNPEYTEYANYITSNYMMEVDRLQYRDDLILNTTDSTGLSHSTDRSSNNELQLAHLNEPVAVPVPGSTTGEVNTIYPAAQQLEVTPAGALIKGQDIAIDGSNVRNSGNIVASRSTTINADNIISTRGQISADTGTLALSALANIDLERTKLDANVIDIVAGQNFIGKGISIKSDGNTSIFAGGDATITSYQVASNYKWGRRDVSAVSNMTSSLETGGDLSIVSMSDIVLAGVDGVIDGNASISALGNITFDAVANEQNVSSGNHKNGAKFYDRESIATTLTVGNNLSASALGGTLTMVGTQVEAGGEISLQGNDVVLAATQDIQTHESVRSKKSIFSKSRTTSSTTSIVHQGVLLAANDNLTVSATGGDLKTAGTDFVSGEGNIALSAAGNVLAGIYTDVFTSKTTKEKSKFFGLIKSNSNTSTQNQYSTGTEAFANVDLSLVSGNDTTLIGAILSAGQNLSVQTGGDLNVLAALSNERFDHFSHDVGLILMTTIQENSYKEFAALSEFLAGGETTFAVDGTTQLTLYNQAGESAVDPYSLYPDELLALEGLELLKQELADEYFYDKQQNLSPAFKALLAVVVSNFILPGIGFTSFLSGTFAQSALGSFLVPGIEAFTSTLIVESIDQAVSGDFDIGAVLEGAAFSGVSAGLTSAINLETFIGEIAKDSPIVQNIFGAGFGSANGLTVKNILDGAIDGVITSGLSSAVYGTDFTESLTTSLINTVINLTLADVQTEIGDTITAMGLSEGSAPHAVLHALAGCAAGAASAAAGDGNAGNGCASGAAAGLAQSIYAGSLNGTTLSDEEQQNRAELFGALAGIIFSGGDASAVSIAGTIARSGLRNNRQLHTIEIQALKEAAKELAAVDENGVTEEQWLTRLTLQAMRQVDKQAAKNIAEDGDARAKLEILIAEHGPDFYNGLGGVMGFLNEDTESALFNNRLVNIEHIVANRDFYDKALGDWAPSNFEGLQDYVSATDLILLSIREPDKRSLNEILPADMTDSPEEIRKAYINLQLMSLLKNYESARKNLLAVQDKALLHPDSQVGVSYLEAKSSAERHLMSGVSLINDQLQAGMIKGVSNEVAAGIAGMVVLAADVALDASGDTEASLRNQQRLESLINLMNNLDQLPDQVANSLRAKAEEMGKLIDQGRFESAGEIIGEFNATAAGIATTVVTLPAAVTSSVNFFRKIAPNRGWCSFHGGTQVLTSGGYSPIKNLKVGMSVWSRNDQTGQMAWKSILGHYSNPYKETVSVTMRDMKTGQEQTIVSNKIHPFFVQVPQSGSLLHPAATGTDNTVPPSSEGHNYQGPIANGHWVDAANLKAGYRLLNSDETWAEVVSVKIEKKALKAYNLTVADFHTYFVRGADNDNAQPIWVHNNCWDSLPDGSKRTSRTTPDGRTIYEGPNGEEIYKGNDNRFYDANVHAPNTGTTLTGKSADQLDDARVRELGVNHEQGGKTDLAEGIGGARYESATGRRLTRSETEGVDFYDADTAISLKGPLVNKSTGQPININDNTIDGLASSVVKDAKFNTASDRIVVDTSGMSSAQRTRLRDQINTGLDENPKEIVFLE